MRKAKKLRASVILLCLLYLGSYALARHAGWFIHRTGYYTVNEPTKKLAEHFVSPGDFGVPILFSAPALARGIAKILFVPLMQLEGMGWYLLVPRDSPYEGFSDWVATTIPAASKF